MDETVRAVSVNDLIKQRSEDIALAFQAFKNGRSTRTPMQRLPRHMRRRAMSHNVKRMPRNWRQYALQSTKKSKHRKKPPSRFYRRRRRFRGEDPTILRTHVWHAKRYHMQKLPGTNLTVPYKCYQKVQRTCLRWAATECCIVDHSYWKTYHVFFETEDPVVKFLMDYCRLKKTPVFEYQRCYDSVIYNCKMDESNGNDCIGPIQIRRITTEKRKYFEFTIDPRSAETLTSLLNSANFQFEAIENQARITLYGPKALDRIIEAFNVCKTSDENLFNDVLDGALLLKGVWFHLNGIVSNTQGITFDLIYRNQGPESIIDIVCDKSVQSKVWLKLVHSRCRPLGITDELNVRAFYGRFSFPDDCSDFLNPLVFSIESKLLLDKHNRRPTNRRVKYETLSPENPFTFGWNEILAKSKSDLIPIKIVPIGKGVPKRFSFIYSEVEEVGEEAPSDEDIEMESETDVEPASKRFAVDEDFIPLITAPESKFKKIVPMSRLFEVEIKPKISRGMKRRAKKKAEKRGEIVVKKEVEKTPDKLFRIPQGTVIGRVVRGLRWSSRHGNKLGLGYCSREALEVVMKNGAIVYFRNPESHKYRKAIISVVSPEARF